MRETWSIARGRPRLIVAAVVAAACVLPVHGGRAAAEDGPKKSKGAGPGEGQLAVAGGGGATVRLVQRVVAPRKGIVTSLGGDHVPQAPGNVAFFATVRKQGDSKAELLWSSYDRWIESELPHPNWSGALAWDPHRRRFVLAHVRTKGPDLRVSLFLLDPSKGAPQVPGHLDPEKPGGWPPASRPAASYKTRRRTIRGGMVVRTVAVPDRTGVLLALERKSETAPVLYLRYAWKTKTWTWMKLIENG